MWIVGVGVIIYLLSKHIDSFITHAKIKNCQPPFSTRFPSLINSDLVVAITAPIFLFRFMGGEQSCAATARTARRRWGAASSTPGPSSDPSSARSGRYSRKPGEVIRKTVFKLRGKLY